MLGAQTRRTSPRGFKETPLDPIEDLEFKTAFVTDFWNEKPQIDLLRVLDRAAEDPDFIAQLTYRGSQALDGYCLTTQEKAALVSGDIKWIEAHVGKLDERLKTWLRCRLGQEIW